MSALPRLGIRIHREAGRARTTRVVLHDMTTSQPVGELEASGYVHESDAQGNDVVTIRVPGVFVRFIDVPGSDE